MSLSMIWGDVLERNALLYPQQEAVVFEGRRYNQREFAALVQRSAQALAALGLARHGRVAILAKNSPEYWPFIWRPAWWALPR